MIYFLLELSVVFEELVLLFMIRRPLLDYALL